MFIKFLILILSISLLCLPLVQAQPNWRYAGHFNFGGNLQLNYGKGQKFAGLRIFAAFIASGLYKDHFMVSYGPSVSVYTKMLGANLNPMVGDLQVDFTNSVSLGYGWDELSYMKYFRSLNNGSYYNLATDRSYAILLTSNFILNNHKHNQVVGAVTFSAPGFTVNYYNDGAAPFDKIPLGDNFDRWWTGGLALFIHNREAYNHAELSFDQFTGYHPLLYELSTMLGINVPLYNTAENDSANAGGKSTRAYNTSAYNLKYFFDRGFAVDLGVMGSLISKGGKAYGLQDIIHVLGGYALHPNNDMNRVTLGVTYNNMRNVKF